MPRLWRHALALLIFLAGYYILTFPCLHYLTTELFCAGGDGLQNYWNNWWVRYAVSHGHSPWYTDHLFHPQGVTLLGATLNPFNGFMTIPLCWVFSPVTAYNLMVVFAFVVGGYTAFLLGRELGCGYWPGILCGAVFTFSPFHFAHAHGHMQLVSLEWLPLFFLAFVRFLRRPTYGWGIFVGVALLLNLLCDHYYFLFCVLSGIVLFIHRAWSLRQPLFFTQKGQRGPMVVFVVASLALSGPLVFSFLATHLEDPFLGAHEEDLYVNDLLAPLIHGQVWRFAPWTEFFWASHPGAEAVAEFGSHLGISILIAAGFGVMAGKRQGEGVKTGVWLLLGVLFYLLSLGPVLLVLGERYPAVPMPMNGLKVLLPILELGGTPVRMSVIYYLAAGVLAAFGVCHAWRSLASRPRLRLSVLALFLVLFSLEYWPGPMPRYRIQQPAMTKVIAELPPGAVLGLKPLAAETLLYQTAFEKPVGGGYIARTPSSRRESLGHYIGSREAGHYERVMRDFEGTYLVRTIDEMPVVVGQDLKCIYRDKTHEIHVLRTDSRMKDRAEVEPGPEPCHARMECSLSHRVEGSTIHFTFRAPGDGGRPFALVFAKDRGTGLRVSKVRRLPVAEDELFRASLDPDNPLFENRGVLDDNGRGTATVRIPEDAIRPGGGFSPWVCLVVFHAGDPETVCRFSKPEQITLR